MGDHALVPVFSDISSLVSSTERYSKLTAKFQELYGAEPDFFARAPGRVNLIGEHVDYSGYPVLPMVRPVSPTVTIISDTETRKYRFSGLRINETCPNFRNFGSKAIDKDTIIAVKVNHDSDKIIISNLDSSKYPTRTVPVANPIIDSGKHEWSNYFLCGYKGVLEHEKRTNDLKGFTALVHGTVPIGSGLSSSAALVCASAIATTVVNDIKLSKAQLADICAKAEQYVGVQSGGMDQAISFLGQKGSASKIEFNPLRTSPVPLPSGVSFIVAHSAVEANKYVTAGTGYNVRVVECKLAAALLAKSLNLPAEKVKILVDIQRESGASLAQCVEFVEKYLHKEEYTRGELCSLLGLQESELVSSFIGTKITLPSFKLYQRAKHVYMESHLVEQFVNLASASNSGADLAQRLGDLMNQSHFSCRDLFECSCNELDALTQLARDSGALGARLTGAGWGGCSVSMVPSDKVDSFLTNLRQEYYLKRQPAIDDAHVGEFLFSTTPCAGAFVYKNTCIDAAFTVLQLC